MAVLDKLPSTNLKWCDIRDTLNANGGNVTNFIQDAFCDGSITLDAPVPATNYGVCDTQASITEKAVSITGITSYTSGLLVNIKFSNTNTATGQLTLNVNSLGAKNINGTDYANNKYYSFHYNGSSFVCCGVRNTTYSPDAKINKWSCWKPMSRGISAGELTTTLIKQLASGLNINSTYNENTNPRGCKFTVTSGTSSAVKKLVSRVLDNYEESNWMPKWDYIYPIAMNGNNIEGIGFIGDYRNYDPSSVQIFDITSVSGFNASSASSWSASINQGSQSSGGLVPNDIFGTNHHYGYILANYDKWLENNVLYIEYIKVNATSVNANGGTSISTSVGSGSLNPGTGTYIFIPFIADTESAVAQYWSQFTNGLKPMNGDTLQDAMLEKLGTIIALDEQIKNIYIVNSFQWPKYCLKHGKVYRVPEDTTIYNLSSTPYFNVTKRNFAVDNELIFQSESRIEFSSADASFRVGMVNFVLSLDVALEDSLMSNSPHWVTIMNAFDIDNADITLQLYIEKIDDDFFFTKARLINDSYIYSINLNDYYGDNIYIPTRSLSRGEKPFVRIQIRNYGTGIANHIVMLIGLKESGSDDYAPNANNDSDLTSIDMTPAQSVQFSNDGDFVVGYVDGRSMSGLVIKNMSFYVISNK